jgi:hypothetical protein
MTTKTFDCVEMKRRGAEALRQRLAGMTLEQEIEFWRQRSEEFEREQQRLRAPSGPAPARESSPM